MRPDARRCADREERLTAWRAVLAINRYFDNPAFLNYLQYLKYWKQPQYAKYIVCVALLGRS